MILGQHQDLVQNQIFTFKTFVLRKLRVICGCIEKVFQKLTQNTWQPVKQLLLAEYDLISECLDGPVIEQEQTNIKTSAGEEIHITCIVNAFPPPQVTWTR